ncbi:T9SS type A sorting domain-containing protein, partial [bacterium]|nr:T9SS type A sorting domain-containing protein [bacterium]
GEPRGRLAAIDLVTGEALPWDPQIEGVVRSVAYRDGVVYAGGDFSGAAGIRREHFAVLSGATNSPVAASALPAASGALALQPVAPHPLHGDGSVTFVLPREEAVDLTLHDVAGRRVRTLLDGNRMTAGPHTVPIRTDGLAGGVYFLRLDAAGERRSTKVVVPGR